MKPEEKILLVDDEPLLLEALRRGLRSHFEIEIAEGGAKGLEALAERGPFAVVVSDLRMPGMDGIEFLRRARSASPETIRIILSGQADVETTIAAVNEQNIFRFLTKPCEVSVLARVLGAAIEQYRLVNVERELLQKTLMGSVTVLTELLAVVYPAAFRRSARIKRYVKLLVGELKLPNLWQFEVAAILSQIGCITLPMMTADKIYSGEEISDEERRLYARHPVAAKAFLRNIPRLEASADMIAGQQKAYREYESEADTNLSHVVVLGAQMLHLAVELDRLVGDGSDIQASLAVMAKRTGEFNPELLRVMGEVGAAEEWRATTVGLEQLNISMVADEDIRAGNGLILVPKGESITSPSLERLRSFASELGIVEPIRVLIPQGTGELLGSVVEVGR